MTITSALEPAARMFRAIRDHVLPAAPPPPDRAQQSFTRTWPYR